MFRRYMMARIYSYSLFGFNTKPDNVRSKLYKCYKNNKKKWVENLVVGWPHTVVHLKWSVGYIENERDQV